MYVVFSRYIKAGKNNHLGQTADGLQGYECGHSETVLKERCGERETCAKELPFVAALTTKGRR